MHRAVASSGRLIQAEKHSEIDKAWELKLSKKYNDLAGNGSKLKSSVEEAAERTALWEAAYPDQNIPHAFTGILQRFETPIGDCNHEILATITQKVAHRASYPKLF
jgi:hypothetical protein